MKLLGSRITRTLVVLSFLSVGGVAAADQPKAKRGRPHQVVPTGADDAPNAPAADAQAEAELEQMTSRSTVGLVEVTRADGTTVVDLDGRFMSVAVAGADGTSGCHVGKPAVTAARARHVRSKRKAPRAARPALVRTPAPAPTSHGLEVM